jgi:hypothetical protein
MILVIAYVAFVVYAAGLFVYSVTHERRWAAIGILLSVSGFQLAIMETIEPTIAIGITIVGLVSVARDLALALQPRLATALIRTHLRAGERA